MKMDGVVPSRNNDGSANNSYGSFFNMNNKKSVKEDALLNQLWHACAGPSVYVPQNGDIVFYFPQGHLEQIAAFVERDGHMEMPAFNLPSKILCKVVCSELEAEAYTDEVYAKIDLHPILEQNQHSLMEEDNHHLHHLRITSLFSKTLTQSDASAHCGFSIPKQHADECFPPMDMTLETPSQELVVKDLHGFEWHFRHIYRGQPKRHMLTSGWSTFVNSKRLVAGDTCIFIRGQNGELGVGVRRAMKPNNRIKSIISGHCMQVGILANVAVAMEFGSTFTVFYHPWTNPNEFVVSMNQYVKSTRIDYSIGMRIKMEHDIGDSVTMRYEGKIIGKEAIDGINWPHSEWRCLKVQWDAVQNTSMQHERVCPWSIEPMESTQIKNIPILPMSKKGNILDISSSDLCGSAKINGQDLIELSHHRSNRNLEAQGYNEVGPSWYAPRPELLKYDNKGHVFMQNPFFKSLLATMTFPNENTSTSSLIPPSPIITSHGFCNGVSVARYSSVSNVNSEEFASREKDGAPFEQQDNYGKCILFGCNLVDSHPKLSSSLGAQVTTFEQIPTCPPDTTMSHSSINATIPIPEPSKNVSSDSSRKQCVKYFSNIRRFTKVLMYGNAIRRSIDLTRFDGYDELISELDRMFDFDGGLIDGRSGWHVVGINEDGDIVVFGECPWQCFQVIVTKMIVCPKEDVGKKKLDCSAHLKIH